MTRSTYAISVNAQNTQKWTQYIAALSAAGGALAVGAALGWPAPAARLIEGEEDDRFFPITQSEFDWTASVITIGCAISCLPIGILMKMFGRKWTMIGLVVPFIIGWALVIWAQNFVMLLIGRLFLGLAGGAFCVSSPQYSAEIAEKEIRGITGTFFQVLINVGILLVYVVGAFMSVFWTSVIMAIIPIVFGLVFFLMPESPVYLVIKRRNDDAVKSYKWLRGADYDPEEEMEELTREVEENEKNKMTFGQIFSRKASQRALMIGFGLMFFQQVSGINIVIFYSTIIFEATDTEIDANYQTIIVGSVLLISTLFASFTVDRLGRKILLGVSSATMTVMLGALGAYFYLLENEFDVSNLTWLPLTSLSIFLVAFSFGYGPVPWLMLSEVYSKEYNAIASPITASFNWLLAFAITSTFNYISDAIGIGATFWIFAGLTFIGFFFSVFIVIETKAKTMVEIQRILAGEKIMN